METLMLIKSLNLPGDITDKIIKIHKHNVINYKSKFNEVNKHLLYYSWLNKKINKKDHKDTTLLQTIKEFDYYNVKDDKV